jgi:quinol-cytochrome oxidoreductase complex cytochrome b subunit
MNMPRDTKTERLLQRIVTIEGLLVQTITYLALWLIDSYLAKVVSLLVGGVAAGILVVSILVEWVDRSRVPRVYYRVVLWCLLGPLLGGLLGWLLAG